MAPDRPAARGEFCLPHKVRAPPRGHGHHEHHSHVQRELNRRGDDGVRRHAAGRLCSQSPNANRGALVLGLVLVAGPSGQEIHHGNPDHRRHDGY
jgi:hypothetical protein